MPLIMRNTFCVPSRRKIVLNSNSAPSEHGWFEPLVSESDLHSLCSNWFWRIHLIVLSKISALQFDLACSEILEWRSSARD